MSINYARTYEDIGNAVKGSMVVYTKQYLSMTVAPEGRLPLPIQEDEPWYLAQHADVAESIRQGKVESARQHFDRDGYREGRLPFWPVTLRAAPMSSEGRLEPRISMRLLPIDRAPH